MLTIKVGATEVYDEDSGEFRIQGGEELRLEHSLVALSKWEAIYEKPFLGEDTKSTEEILSYIKCMAVGETPPEDFLQRLSEKNFEAINAYIDAKMTATWFSDQPGTPRTSELITSELIYYWMTVFKINWEAQHWHLNRLFTLIRIANVKNAKPKKMSRAEIAQRNRALNEQRRKQLGTKG